MRLHSLLVTTMSLIVTGSIIIRVLSLYSEIPASKSPGHLRSFKMTSDGEESSRTESRPLYGCYKNSQYLYVGQIDHVQ